MRIIIDTDFGDDIDDGFAIAYLLKTAADSISYILTCFGQTDKRAALLKDFLSRCGHGHIRVGAGKKAPMREPYMLPFLVNSPPAGGFPADGIEEAARIISESREPVTFIELGPFTNLAELIYRHPECAGRIRVCSMAGSIYKGYFGSPKPDREYNAAADAPSFNKALALCESVELAPLDTCGEIFIRGEGFDRLISCEERVTAELMSDFKKWLSLGFVKADRSTSCLYDVLAAYMALSHDCLEFESLPITENADGLTLISPGAREALCALRWTDLDGFTEHITDVFTSQQ